MVQILGPVRYGQRKFRAGGLGGSVFSLIAGTLGSGTISFPYAVMMNGYILGPILIVLGALVSYYTAMLIVRCAEKTGSAHYEGIAMAVYGSKMAKLTSILNLLCLIGFTFSYIVYVKQAVPAIIEMNVDENTVPDILSSSETGVTFWAFVFAYLILFPLSIPRRINKLRFSSLFGVLCSMYLCIAVTVVFFTDKEVIPRPENNLSELKAFRVSYTGVVSTFPLIIFGYMYQVLIPEIYLELEQKDERQMAIVVASGTGVGVFFYILVGIFGYATFLDPSFSSNLCSKNILEADYAHNAAIGLGNYALLFAVMSATPLCILPSKDTVEELFYKEKGMTKVQNFVVTFLLVTVSLVLALFIGTIGEAMTLVGSTINPIIGFILPIVFYWPYAKKEPGITKDKLLMLSTLIIIVVASVLSLIQFFAPVSPASDEC